MSKAHKVTGAAATPYREDGERIYLYAGAILPDGLRKGEVERLTDLGLVSEVTVDDADSSDGPPAKSASKGDWEAYARSQGATDEDLDGKTKDELVSTYGS